MNVLGTLGQTSEKIAFQAASHPLCVRSFFAKCKFQLGFTLIELLASLTLLVIVLFFSLPQTSVLYKKNQMRLISDGVKEAIQTAKIQALLLNESLVLAPLSGTNDWSQGLMLFADNSKHQFIPGMKLLYEWHWPSSGVNIVWHGFKSEYYLIFAPDIRHNATNGYFMIKNTAQQVRLIVNRLGRIKQEN